MAYCENVNVQLWNISSSYLSKSKYYFLLPD